MNYKEAIDWFVTNVDSHLSMVNPISHIGARIMADPDPMENIAQTVAVQ